MLLPPWLAPTWTFPGEIRETPFCWSDCTLVTLLLATTPPPCGSAIWCCLARRRTLGEFGWTATGPGNCFLPKTPRLTTFNLLCCGDGSGEGFAGVPAGTGLIVTPPFVMVTGMPADNFAATDLLRSLFILYCDDASWCCCCSCIFGFIWLNCRGLAAALAVLLIAADDGRPVTFLTLAGDL